MDAFAIHQVVSYWSEAEGSLLGKRGVGPVHTSFPPDELVAWWQYLAAYSQLNQQDAPAGSLVYLVVQTSDGMNWATVIRRVPALDPGEQRINTLSHMLVGPTDVLTPTQALRMMRWPHWFGCGWRGELRLASAQVEPSFVGKTLSPADLSSRDDEQFAAVQPHYREATVRLLAETLRNPDRPFVVVCGQLPEPDRVLHTVVDVLRAPLAVVPGATWTFSTFDDEEAPPEGPRFSFVARRGRSSYQSVRVPVDPYAPSREAPDLVDGFAEDLVSFYEDEGSEQLAEFVSVDPVPRDAAEVPHWVDLVARRLAAFYATELRLLRDALTHGTRLGEHAPAGYDASWMRLLPKQLDDLDPAGFARMLRQWQGSPSTWAGGARLPASALVGPEVLAALGRQAAQAAFTFALTGDGHGEQLALNALVECACLPNDVFDEMARWWQTVGDAELTDRLRVLDVALRASETAITNRHTTVAEFDREAAAKASGQVLRDVTPLQLVQGLAGLAAGNRMLFLLLEVLAARSARMSRRDRAQVLDFLARADVQFLAVGQPTLTLDEQQVVRGQLVKIGFTGDVLREKRAVERVVSWIRNGTMDDQLALAVQDEADEHGAVPMVSAIAMTHSDRFRLERGLRQLRTSAVGDVRTEPAGSGSPAAPQTGSQPGSSDYATATPDGGWTPAGEPSEAKPRSRSKPKPKSKTTKTKNREPKLPPKVERKPAIPVRLWLGLGAALMWIVGSGGSGDTRADAALPGHGTTRMPAPIVTLLAVFAGVGVYVLVTKVPWGRLW